MANIIPAADILGSSNGVYLSKEDKERLHADQSPFWMTGAVAEQEGQYGVQTVFAIREKGADEDTKLAFSTSPSRIEQAKRISMAIANGADGVGPFYLGRWDNNGRSGWMLTHEPTTPSTTPMPTSGAPAAPSAAPHAAPHAAPLSGTQAGAADDDLPFAPSLV